MRKKRWLAAFSCVVVCSIVGLVACNEEDKEDVVLVKKDAVVAEKIVIAKCKKDSDQIELLFNADTVAFYAEQEATKKLLTDVVIESIKVDDPKPNDANCPPYIVCSSFLSSRGITNTFAVELVKYEDEESGDILYQMSSNAETTASCEGFDCQPVKPSEIGCGIHRDYKDRIDGCTSCKNKNGHCKSSVGNQTSSAIFAAVASFIRF